MKRKQHKEKRLTRKERRHKYISGTLAVLAAVLLGYQAISGIITGDWVGGLNYYGQPVDPFLQLIFLIVVVFVGAVSAWRFFFGKEETKKEKKAKQKSSYYKYPHQNMPWQ